MLFIPALVPKPNGLTLVKVNRVDFYTIQYEPIDTN